MSSDGPRAGAGGEAEEDTSAEAAGQCRVEDRLDKPLVWIDLEMTGLDPDEDLIIEIATIITDGRLQTVIEGPDLVVNASNEVLEAMDPVVVNMHAGSGLTELVRSTTTTVAEAQEQTLDFVRQHLPEASAAPLAGNTVHADRAFLRRHMPELEQYLHYRNVDVSTFKEMARRFAPELLERAPAKGGSHRALADIRESIEELRFYAHELFGRLPTTSGGSARSA